MRSLLIVPTYNEVENLPYLFSRIWSILPKQEILIVDDNSTDGTKEILSETKSSHPTHLHLLARPGKMGLGTAYIAGFKWALDRGYDAVIEMDADLSHNPDDLPKMLEMLITNPVVVGSRYVEGGGTKNWNFSRKIISRFGSFYARTILGMTTRDLTGGFNGWQSEVLRQIDLDQVSSEGYSFQIELKYRAKKAGFAIVEFPILFTERRAGYSKMSSRIVIEAMLKVWSLRLHVT